MKDKDDQNQDSVLGNLFLVGPFVPVEGIVHYVDSIDGSDNANWQ